MQTTRQEILDFLRRNSRGTVRELSGVLGLTSTGVRQHLSVLEREGLIATHEERGKVGRPALVYTLTERAQQLYPKQYDVLANAMLDEIKAKTGGAGLLSVVRGAAARMVEQNMHRVEGKSFEDRVVETATIMQEQGLIVELETRDGEAWLHECTCPYPAVARRHPAVCALEVDMVRRLTGGDARLTTSLLRGDRACTYRIRPTPASTRG
jgi:predicted ArsR family transcriptional regulator